MEIQIDYLKDHPDLVKEITCYFYDEWSYLCPERSLKDFEDSIRERMNYDRIPLALVAVTNDGRFLGTVCLKEHDMDTHKELTPWLAGLYVKEEFRSLGIGKLLIERIIEEARKLKIETLYLFTPSAEKYYSKLGWEAVSHEKFKETDVCIMKKSLK
jgi:predicted N-acetyltransferase YhbS